MWWNYSLRRDKEYSDNIQHTLSEVYTKAKQTKIMFLAAGATRDR